MAENKKDEVNIFTAPLSTKLCETRKLVDCEKVKHLGRKLRGPQIASDAKWVL